MPTRTIGEDVLIELVRPQERRSLVTGTQFLPVLDSPSADVRGPIVFVGYGIADPSRGVDDYAGVDVRNKIVLFLRGKPDRYTAVVAQADKERVAKEKGAIAYLLATGPILTAYEQRRGVTGAPSAFYSTTPSTTQLPGAWISTETAEWILEQGATGTTTLHAVQEELNRTGLSKPVVTEVPAQMRWTSSLETGTFYNVMSIIRGHTVHSDETVLVEAHRDHFGRQAGCCSLGRTITHPARPCCSKSRESFLLPGGTPAVGSLCVVQRGRTGLPRLATLCDTTDRPLVEHDRHDQRGSCWGRQWAVNGGISGLEKAFPWNGSAI